MYFALFWNLWYTEVLRFTTFLSRPDALGFGLLLGVHGPGPPPLCVVGGARNELKDARWSDDQQCMIFTRVFWRHFRKPDKIDVLQQPSRNAFTIRFFSRNFAQRKNTGFSFCWPSISFQRQYYTRIQLLYNYPTIIQEYYYYTIILLLYKIPTHYTRIQHIIQESNY